MSHFNVQISSTLSVGRREATLGSIKTHFMAEVRERNLGYTSIGSTKRKRLKYELSFVCDNKEVRCLIEMDDDTGVITLNIIDEKDALRRNKSTIQSVFEEIFSPKSEQGDRSISTGGALLAMGAEEPANTDNRVTPATPAAQPHMSEPSNGKTEVNSVLQEELAEEENTRKD